MTIYDIAKQAGVSVSTVSRVLNGRRNIREETRRKVQAVLDGSDYTPSVFARGLANSTMHMVGVLAVDIRNHHHSDIAFTIEQEFGKLGYGCVLCNTGLEMAKQEGYIRAMAARKVDGVVCIGSVFQNNHTQKLLTSYFPNTPVVIANGYLPLPNVRGVICDEYTATMDCVAHLAAKGHTRIAFVRDNDTASNAQKWQGYLDGLARCALETDERLRISRTDASFQGGYEATERLLAQGTPFGAVIFTEDPAAVGGVKCLIGHGRRVPEDVEVIGFNNSAVAKLSTPDLTSVDNQMEATGIAAARMLYDMLSGVATPPRLMLSAEIVYRNSSPARGACLFDGKDC